MKTPLYQRARATAPAFSLFLFFFLLIPSIANSQSTPCDCGHRFQDGAKWVSGNVDDTPDPFDFPLGVGRFQTDKEIKIRPNGCTYNSSTFPIVCGNPPNEGDRMVWINFDVREQMAKFKMKIKNKNSTPIQWALYYSAVRQAGTNPPNDLSGSCNDLILQTCGSSQSFQNITQQDPSQPTNYYLAVWSSDATLLKKVKFFLKKAGPNCDEPPLAACQDQVNVSLGLDGTATVDAETFTDGAFDLCTPTEELQYRIRIPATGGGTVPSDASYTFDCDDIDHLFSADIWVGDEGGNWSFCTTNILVEDKLNVCIDCNAPPTIICQSQVNVSLGPDGTATVDAENFTDSAFDLCTPIENLQYRIRIPGTGGGTVPSDLSYTFTCGEVGNFLNADIWVGDEDGNWDFCMTTVLVEDKIPAVIICPSNVLLNCEDDVSDLNSTGQATAFDNCIVNDLTYTDLEVSTACGVTQIIRTWTANSNGSFSTCNQIINILPSPPLQATDITWPTDFSSQDCNLTPADLVPSLLTPPYNQPTWNSSACSQIAYTYNDILIPTSDCEGTFKILRNWTVIDFCNPNDVFTHAQILQITSDGFTLADITWPNDFTSEDCSLTLTDLQPNLLTAPYNQPILATTSCNQVAYTYEDLVIDVCEASFKVLRTWTVFNWCTAETFTHIQILRILDFEPPVIDGACPDLIFCCTAPNCTINLSTSATDNCSSTLNYNYAIDLGSDNIVDESNSGNSVTGFYPLGTHLVTWTVEDACGNISNCIQQFTIGDCGESITRDAGSEAKQMEKEQAPFTLYQNYPNPVDDRTIIEFELPETDGVQLELFDVNGRQLKTFDQFNQGFNQIILQQNDFPTSGIFYYRLSSPSKNSTKKMIVL